MIHKPTTPKIYTPQDKSCVLNLDARDVRGSKIYDRSGKGNHGAITGAVLKPSNYGIPVLDFDGVDDYVNVTDDASIDEIRTVEMWVNNKDIAQGSNIGLFYKHYNPGFLILVRNPGNGITVYINSDSGTLNDIDFFIGEENQWVHLVVAYDKDATTVKLYKNGVEVSSGSASGNIANATDVHLGRYGSNYFNGSIDQVKIYSRALSAQEILEIFNKLRHRYGI